MTTRRAILVAIAGVAAATFVVSATLAQDSPGLAKAPTPEMLERQIGQGDQQLDHLHRQIEQLERQQDRRREQIERMERRMDERREQADRREHDQHERMARPRRARRERPDRPAGKRRRTTAPRRGTREIPRQIAMMREVITQLGQICSDPAQAGLLALGAIKDDIPREPTEVIEDLEARLKKTRSLPLRNAIRLTLKDLYKQTGQHERAVDHMQLMLAENDQALKSAKVPARRGPARPTARKDARAKAAESADRPSRKEAARAVEKSPPRRRKARQAK